MNTPLTALRTKRCAALLAGCGDFLTKEVSFLSRARTDQFLAMLTDEAVEQLAFKFMAERKFRNKLTARNRALTSAH